MTDAPRSLRQQRAFPSTQWSVVLAARRKFSPESTAALETLCREYWYPLYAYIRRMGRSPADAEDLTQGFFEQLLEKDFLKAADPEKGRFRTFILVAMQRFAAKAWHREHAQKRGGHAAHVPIDSVVAEERYAAEPAGITAAQELFDRRWALTLIETTLGRLRAEYETRGAGEVFGHLKVLLTGAGGDAPLAEAAKGAGLTPSHARVVLHRMRKRFREIFREEIARTVREPSDVDEEIRYLKNVLARSGPL